MNTCPVCGNAMENDICPVCGFYAAADVLAHPTLSDSAEASLRFCENCKNRSADDFELLLKQAGNHISDAVALCEKAAEQMNRNEIYALIYKLKDVSQELGQIEAAPASAPVEVSTRADFVIKGGVLTEYRGTAPVVEVPAGTTAIANAAFYGNGTITEVTLPTGLKTIGASAFAYCRNLRKVSMCDGITTIETMAFYGAGLRGVTIPGSVRELPEYCFYKCPDLKNVVLKPGVKKFYANSFKKNFFGEISIESLTVCDSIDEIIGTDWQKGEFLKIKNIYLFPDTELSPDAAKAFFGSRFKEPG